MIGGVITVVWLLVTRMPSAFATNGLQVPAELKLPGGATAEAVTFGKGWTAVVTSDDRILVFDRKGALVQDIAVKVPAEP